MKSWPRKWGLKKKLISVLLIVGLFPLSLSLVTSYFSQKTILTKTMGTAFQELARETSIKLRLLLVDFVNEANLVGKDPKIRSALIESNRSYSSGVPIEDGVSRGFRAWTDLDADFRKEIMEGKVSAFFKRESERHPDLFLQVILVDSHGRLVGVLKEPRYYQFSEFEWWRAAYQGGDGSTYIGEIRWDDPMNHFSLPIAVPVKDEDEVIGILLAKFKVDRVDESVTSVHLGETDHAMLVNSKGELLFCPVFEIGAHRVNQDLIHLVSTGSPGWITSQVDIHFPGKKAVSGFAPVKFTLKGLSQDSLGGTQWFIITSQDPTETYQSLNLLIGWTALSAIVGVLILLGLSMMMSHWIVSPVIKLRSVSEEIISGIVHLPGSGEGKPTGGEDGRVSQTVNQETLQEIMTGDEIEDLAVSFSKMNQALDRTRHQLMTTTQRLQEMATTDELTGLFNRHYIWEALQNEFVRTQRFKLVLSCLMIDLDFFKAVNDQYGHPAGDQVLKELASLLRENSRGPDIIGRFGGEEFIILLPHTNSTGASMQAERLRVEVEKHHFPISEGGGLRMTISIGMSTYPDPRIEDVNQLIQVADQALYTSKKSGRNRSTAG